MSKRKILLAEDDGDDQTFFQDFLRYRNDIELISIVEDGEAVFEVLNSTGESDVPDVIILDQNMPKRNGLQTLQMLKKHPRYKTIPVVIYSTYTDENLIRSGREHGACEVLPKPITREGYDQMVNVVLEFCIR